jgi:hypothetical protein
LLVASISRFHPEDKEIASDRLDRFLKLLPRRVSGSSAQEAVEPALEVGKIGFQDAVGQLLSPPSDDAGALVQAGRKNAVGLIDDVLNLADQMRKAELMRVLGAADLAAQSVRQPDVGPPIAEDLLDHRLGAAGVGHEGHAVAVTEDP